MQGTIDSSFQTEQRDLFTSGAVAEIGVNAYAVWHAIKHHADFTTGQAWPGMRRLAQLVGLSKSSIDRAVDTLQRAHMLRIVKRSTKDKGANLYRTRAHIGASGEQGCLHSRFDYIPSRLRGQIIELEKALLNPNASVNVFAEVEIIPGNGFEWDSSSGLLRGRIHASELPKEEDTGTELNAIQDAILKRIAPLKK
jgi:hypothetical protein